jgi:hypothetical protein
MGFMFNPKIIPLENLQNEIAGEKYSTLHRISQSLTNCLSELEILEDQINNAINNGISKQDINKMIETFNCLIDNAEEWRYYFSVTREASGFFHGDLASNIYKIPPRKEFI